MPCYLKQFMALNLSAANIPMLERALTTLGYRKTSDALWVRNGTDIVNLKTWQVMARDVPAITNELKRAYANAAVVAAAKQAKWEVKAKGQNAYALVKR